jgi:hypothetical protein
MSAVYDSFESPPLASSIEAPCCVLDRHSDPLFIVDPGRELHFSNVAAKRVLETHKSLKQQGRRLSMGSPAEDRRLEQLLASMLMGTGSGPAHSRGLRLHRSGTHQAWAVAVHPLRVQQSPGQSAPLFLLHAVSRLHSRGSLELMLRDLFGLSSAEIAAAMALLHTGSVDNAARALSVSRETVRTHLKAVFRKCDIHSTLELAALLRSTSLFGGPDPKRATDGRLNELCWEAT